MCEGGRKWRVCVRWMWRSGGWMGKVEDEGRDVMVVYLHFVQFVGPSLDGSLHK